MRLVLGAALSALMLSACAYYPDDRYGGGWYDEGASSSGTAVSGTYYNSGSAAISNPYVAGTQSDGSYRSADSESRAAAYWYDGRYQASPPASYVSRPGFERSCRLDRGECEARLTRCQTYGSGFDCRDAAGYCASVNNRCQGTMSAAY